MKLTLWFLLNEPCFYSFSNLYLTIKTLIFQDVKPIQTHSIFIFSQKRIQVRHTNKASTDTPKRPKNGLVYLLYLFFFNHYITYFIFHGFTSLFNTSKDGKKHRASLYIPSFLTLFLIFLYTLTFKKKSTTSTK